MLYLAATVLGLLAIVALCGVLRVLALINRRCSGLKPRRW